MHGSALAADDDAAHGQGALICRMGRNGAGQCVVRINISPNLDSDVAVGFQSDRRLVSFSNREGFSGALHFVADGLARFVHTFLKRDFHAAVST